MEKDKKPAEFWKGEPDSLERVNTHVHEYLKMVLRGNDKAPHMDRKTAYVFDVLFFDEEEASLQPCKIAVEKKDTLLYKVLKRYSEMCDGVIKGEVDLIYKKIY